MIKEIYKNIFVNEVSLPKNPLRAINCYMIKSEDRILVIDSAFDHPESEEVFFKGLEEIGAEVGKTDMFITHLHADHSGLAYKFQQKYKGKLYTSPIDLEFINTMHKDLYSGRFMPMLKLIGINDGVEFFETHPGLVYCVKHDIDPILLNEGDSIDIGEYHFEIVEVPGHTPGQIALYERKNKILFSGDHILTKITPNISFWGFEYGDILGTYLKNLDKIYNMDVNIIFSAHRAIVDNPKQRIIELKEHYKNRAAEVLNILKEEKECTAAQMAAKMHWDYRAANFNEFPNNQKWFAGGEALANLEHLKALHLASCDIRDGVAYYKFLEK